MNAHQSARLTPLGRERRVSLIQSGVSFAAAGRACGCSPKTASIGWRRFPAEDRQGLRDRSSGPCSLRNPTPDAVRAQIIALRRQRLSGAHIGAKTGASPADVWSQGLMVCFFRRNGRKHYRTSSSSQRHDPFDRQAALPPRGARAVRAAIQRSTCLLYTSPSPRDA